MTATLLCDLGNSRVKLAMCDAQSAELSAHDAQSCGGAADCEKQFAAYRKTRNAHPEAVLFASVRDDKTNAAALDAARKVFGVLPRTPAVAFDAFGIVSDYNEAMLGIDRFLAMVGVGATDKACVIVDCGTATTIDFMEPGGRHRGGFILPGARMMRESLAAGAGRLPEVQAAPAGAPPHDTHAAIAEGCSKALWHATGGLIDDWAGGRDAEVVVTGGDAAHVMRDGWLERPHLVLEGLARHAQVFPSQSS